MKVAVGCDHAGFAIKLQLLEELAAGGHTVVDCGAMEDTPSDYPDVAAKVAHAIKRGEAERGVLVCGSGVGAAMAANKIAGIRAGVCHDCYSARQAVEHDAMHVLCLGSRVVGAALAADLVRVFLSAEFTGEERHVRRLKKIELLEQSVE